MHRKFGEVWNVVYEIQTYRQLHHNISPVYCMGDVIILKPFVLEEMTKEDQQAKLSRC